MIATVADVEGLAPPSERTIGIVRALFWQAAHPELRSFTWCRPYSCMVQALPDRIHGYRWHCGSGGNRTLVCQADPEAPELLSN